MKLKFAARLLSLSTITFCFLQFGYANTTDSASKCLQVLTGQLTTQSQFFPFHRYTPENLEAQLEQALEIAKQRLQAIVDNPEAPTFENTILALEDFNRELTEADTAASVYLYHVRSGLMADVADKMSPIISEFEASLLMNEKLYARVQAVYRKRQNYKGEDRALIIKVQKSFKNNGINLSPEKREKFIELTTKIQKLGLQFARNMSDSNVAIQWHIVDPALLAGVPDHLVALFKEEANEHNKTGYIVSASMLTNLISYAHQPDVRERAYYMSKQLAKTNEHDNRPIAIEIAKLRRELAQLMGYESYSDHKLKELMVGNQQTARQFLQSVVDMARPYAKAELEELSQAKESTEGNRELKPWDTEYYSRKIKQLKYQFN